MKKMTLNEKDRQGLYRNGRYIAYNYMISVLLILLIEILARHSLTEGISFVWNHPFLTLYSALALTAFYSLALLFPKRNFVWICITVLVLALAVANSILLFFRITPLAATDIALITSVFEIMDVYLTLWQIILILVLVLVLLISIIFLGIKMKRQLYAFWTGLATALVLIALLVGLTNIGDNAHILQTEFANLPDAYADNGFVYCFMRSLFDRGIEKPETYSEEAVDDIMTAIKTQQTNEVTETPNVIFLQIESFIDLSRMKGVTYSENPIPVYSSLRESCQTGFLTVPSVGAGTANTEFEIITGMNLDYFGAGEYPYKTILQESTCESLAYNLKELGYHATAIHNNTATFYDRNTVFANLGFDNFTSIEYMKNATYNSIGWSKDKILTQQIMDALKNTTDPDIIYTISVQDHGKYPTDPIENPHIQISGFAPEDEQRQNSFLYFVNQVHETDAFLGSLISTLNACKEPVVLVMYGDHLPNIDITEDELLNGNLFQTEYVMWTNEAMNQTEKLLPEKKDLCAYQLSAYVLGRLGMNNGVLTKFHQTYNRISNYREELKTLQYDMLYGEKEVYDGKEIYTPTQIQMGVQPITVNDVASVGGSVYVMGKNFTECSCVYVNGKKQDTSYLNESTLMVSDKELSEGDIVNVAQLTDVSVMLSETEDFTYEK